MDFWTAALVIAGTLLGYLAGRSDEREAAKRRKP